MRRDGLPEPMLLRRKEKRAAVSGPCVALNCAALHPKLGVYSALPPLVAPTTGIGLHGAANSAGSHSFPFNMVVRPCQRRPRSLLRFASIEGLERVKDSTGLAPKSRFIAAEPIKSEVGKVGETQKAMGEVDIRSVGVFSRVGYRFHLTYLQHCVKLHAG